MSIRKSGKIPAVLVVLLSAATWLPGMRAQTPETNLSDEHKVSDTTVVQTRESFVYLENADEIRFNKRINPDAQILVGNVVFRHDSMYMYCDSALFFQNTNSFNAYLNVHAEQGDTLHLYGDSLYYDGNARIAKVRNNVRLENGRTMLLTDSLNYERNISLGYFLNGGTLLDSLNTLTSDYGQYQTETKFATFSRNVLLETPDYNITSDTLIYNTDTQKAYVVSPSRIINEDNVIETSRAVFDTGNRESSLSERSVITIEDGARRITGDSLYYCDSVQLVRGYGNVIINDFENHADIFGDYVFFDHSIDSAVVTGNAQLIEYSDDSLFLHADTFKIITHKNSADSITLRHFRAYNRVKAYRTDVQMVADSMVFNALDSCLTLYNDPVLWNGDQQVLGEEIWFYMNDSTIDWAHVIGQALFVQRVDTFYYNQIAGREMKAFFKGNQIDRTNVDGNVEVVYFAIDSDSTYIGMNTTEASDLTAYFEDQQISRIVIRKQSSGTLFPMNQIPKDKQYLSNFAWLDNMRPLSRYDIFYWRGKQASEKLKSSSHNRKAPLPTLKKKN